VTRRSDQAAIIHSHGLHRQALADQAIREERPAFPCSSVSGDISQPCEGGSTGIVRPPMDGPRDALGEASVAARHRAQIDVPVTEIDRQRSEAGPHLGECVRMGDIDEAQRRTQEQPAHAAQLSPPGGDHAGQRLRLSRRAPDRAQRRLQVRAKVRDRLRERPGPLCGGIDDAKSLLLGEAIRLARIVEPVTEGAVGVSPLPGWRADAGAARRAASSLGEDCPRLSSQHNRIPRQGVF
jgi:hypothetical protein